MGHFVPWAGFRGPSGVPVVFFCRGIGVASGVGESISGADVCRGHSHIVLLLVLAVVAGVDLLEVGGVFFPLGLVPRLGDLQRVDVVLEVLLGPLQLPLCLPLCLPGVLHVLLPLEDIAVRGAGTLGPCTVQRLRILCWQLRRLRWRWDFFPTP